MSARAIVLWAMDAPTSLAQTFSPSLFKDTAVADAGAPTEILPSRPARLSSSRPARLAEKR
jgi:hypothetical protein